MAAPTLIQSPSLYTTGNNSSETFVGTVGSWDQAVTAGSTLVAIVQQQTQDNRTFSMSDDVDGDWIALPRSYDAGRIVQVFYKRNHTGGSSVDVTLNANANSVKYVTLLEISESWLDVHSRNESVTVDGTNGYPSSPNSDLIDTSTNVFVIAGLVLNANGSLPAASSPWTELYNNGLTRSVKYKTSDTALTNERGYFEETGTDRTGCALIVAFTSNVNTLTMYSDVPNTAFQNTQQFFTATLSPTTVVISATAANQTNGFSKVQSWLTEDWPEADYTIYIDGTVEETSTVSITLNNAKWGQGSLTIQSAPGQHHRGKPGSGAVWKMTSNRISIQAGNTGNELIIQDLDIDWNNTTASGQTGINIVNTGNEYTRIRRCIIRNHVCPVPNQSGAGLITEGTNSGNIEISNNLLFNNKVTLGTNFGGDAYGTINLTGHNNNYNFKVYNNTVYGTGTTGSGAINNCEVYGIRMPGDDNEDSVYNNIVQNVTNGSTGTGTIAACYHSTITSGVNILTGGNISDDTSSGQTALRNITVDFVNTGSEDFHITNSTNNQTNVIGQGDTTIDLLGYQDIDGDYRSNVTPDIGADEYDEFFINQNQFFTGSISTQSAIDLGPVNLYQNSQQFFSHALAYNLDAALYQNSQQFFSHALAYNLDATLYQNTQQFFTATMSPTTVVIGTGHTYTTLSSWSSSQWPRAVYTIQIDGTVEETSFTFGGNNLDTDYLLSGTTLTCVPGQEHRGVPGSGAKLLAKRAGYVGDAFIIRNARNLDSGQSNGLETLSFIHYPSYPELIIQDLEIEGVNSDTGAGYDAFRLIGTGTNYTKITIRRCLIHGLNKLFSNNPIRAIAIDTTAIMNFYSNIVYDIHQSGDNTLLYGFWENVHNNTYSKCTLENNTFYDISHLNASLSNATVRGIAVSDGDTGGDVVLRNNIVQNVSAAGSTPTLQCYSSSSPTNIVHSGNISDDATSPDTTFRNVTVDFVDTANDNYHLADTTNNHTYVIGQASSGSEPDDIDGSPRATGAAANYSDSGTSWDIGADEFRHVALIAASGGDFATINSFHSSVPFYSDWIAKISGVVLETSGTTFDDTTKFSSITIQSNDGEKHNGTPGSGAIVRNNSSATTSYWRIDGSIDFTIQDIEIDMNGKSQQHFLYHDSGNALRAIKRCLIHNISNNRSDNSLVFNLWGANSTRIVEDNIVFNITNVGTAISRAFAFGSNANLPVIIRNNTITNINNTNATSGDALAISFPDNVNVQIYNNLVTDINSTSGTAECYQYSTLSNAFHGGNLSDDATSPDSALRNKTISFKDALNEDYHLASTDTDAIGQGDTTIDLLGYQDIDGDYRSNVTPDIGADEYDEFFVNQNQFFTGSISTQSAIDLGPVNLYQNSQQFFSHALELNLSGNLYQNTQQFFSHALAYNLDAALYQNTQQFFSHEIKPQKILTANLFVNQTQIFEHTISAGLEANLLVNTNQFFSHEIKAQYVLKTNLYQNTNNFFNASLQYNLDANLYTNTNNFFNASLQYNLDANLYTNTNNFFLSEIPITLNANLYTNTNNFFLAKIPITLNANLFTNTNNFFNASLQYNLDANLYTNTNNFYVHSVAGLSADLLVNTNVFYEANIKAQKVLQQNLYTNTNNFFNASLKYNLNASLLDNQNQIYTAGLQYNLNANLFDNQNELYTASLKYNLNASLLDNQNQIYTAGLQYNLNASLYENNSIFNESIIKAEKLLKTNLLVNQNNIYTHVIGGYLVQKNILPSQTQFFTSKILLNLNTQLIVNDNNFYNSAFNYNLNANLLPSQNEINQQTISNISNQIVMII